MNKELISAIQGNEVLMKAIVDGLSNNSIKARNIKTGKIYDGASAAEIATSFSDAFKSKHMNDANTVAVGGMYLSQQLQEILPQILNQIYPNMPILKILAVDNSGALMQSLIQRVQSFSGRHQAKHETSNTAGVITVNRTAREQLIFEYEGTTEYSDTDLKRSMLLNENIDTAIIEGHQWSYQTMMDEISFNGISLKQNDGSATPVTEGLTNYSDVISANYLTAGATFAASSGLEMYNSIKGLYDTMVGQAGAAEELRPNKIVLPPKQFAILATTIMTGTSPVMTAGQDTVLSFIERVLGVKVYASSRCVAASDTGTDLLIMLSATYDNMRLFIPQPLQFAPVFIKGFKYMLESKFRIAGLGVNRANAIGYLKTI